MDGYPSIVLMNKLQAFSEAILPSVECTQIVRSTDDSLDSWATTIFTKQSCYELRRGGGNVRLFAEQLDARDRECTLLCEVTANEEGLDTLRTLLVGWETICELSARENARGIAALWRLLEDDMVELTGARRVVLRNRRRA